VLQERAGEYFVTQPRQESPYMLLVTQVQPAKCLSNCDGVKGLQALERRNEKRSSVPAVTHVDHSARIQTVDRERHGRFYKLLKSFECLTDCPLVINTSFNVRGEPIVCSPDDAYRCFMATNMDLLVIEDVVLNKEEQPKTKLEPQFHLAQFELD
jgi:carbamoyltransferase